jgi:hypothetical protein
LGYLLGYLLKKAEAYAAYHKLEDDNDAVNRIIRVRRNLVEAAVGRGIST